MDADGSVALQADPLTGNRYLYAGANPVNLIDDGHAGKRPKKKTSATVHIQWDINASRLDDKAAEAYLEQYIIRTRGGIPVPQPKQWRKAHHRIPDFYFGGVIYEAKAGKGGTAKRESLDQAYADTNIILGSQGSLSHAEWHFYPGMSGYVGPSAQLARYLLDNDISIVIHLNPEDEKQRRKAQRFQRQQFQEEDLCQRFYVGCILS